MNWLHILWNAVQMAQILYMHTYTGEYFMPYSILILLGLSLVVATSNAQSSFELTCRNQAKEIAAETYKNCVTENRKAQVEDIRSEYQQKLSDLKSHYDGELKKISAGQNRSNNGKSIKSGVPITSNIAPKDKSVILKRPSGARELPEKKSVTSTVKTELMDFTQAETINEKPEQKNESVSSANSNVEIIEIPVTE